MCVWDVDYAFGEPERIVLEGITRMKAFFKSIGLPASLTEMNVPHDRLEEMAAKGTQDGPLGNFKKLYKKDVYNILIDIFELGVRI